MSNAIVDDAKRVLARADLEPKCLKCGSRRMFVSYSREFLANLDEETSEEAIGSSPDPYNITCSNCGETIYEE